MEECFLPGDIVKAKILSYGDSKKIYLTTAENELGVMYAKSLNYSNVFRRIKTHSLFLGKHDLPSDSHARKAKGGQTRFFITRLSYLYV